MTTITIRERTVFGNKKIVVADFGFDAAYPTGGESLTKVDLGLNSIDLLLASDNAGYTFEYDYTTSKIKANHVDQAVDEGGIATYTINIKEVASGANLSAVSVRILAIGN